MCHHTDVSPMPCYLSMSFAIIGDAMDAQTEVTQLADVKPMPTSLSRPMPHRVAVRPLMPPGKPQRKTALPVARAARETVKPAAKRAEEKSESLVLRLLRGGTSP